MSLLKCAEVRLRLPFTLRCVKMRALCCRFFIRDGMKFPDMVHALKPNPKNHIQEAWRIMDFFSHIPESMSMVRCSWVLLPMTANHISSSAWDRLVACTGVECYTTTGAGSPHQYAFVLSRFPCVHHLACHRSRHLIGILLPILAVHLPSG